MGDRANFGFKQSNGHVLFLYGHWAGHDMLTNLARAIEVARPRWRDESYATRIAISQLVGEQWRDETGWGLSIDTIGDNEHSVPVVDWDKQTVTRYAYSWDKPFTMSKATIIDCVGLNVFVNRFANGWRVPA